MISYWVTEDGSFGIDAYRENRGRTIADRFHTLIYERIGPVVRVSGGAQIFSSLDRLTDGQRTAVAAIWDGHARLSPNAPRLNDPRRVLLRFDLLTALHAQGVNRHRVYRAADLRHVDRFPVFVRHMHDHSGPRTGLLHSRPQVAAALCALRLRGHALRNLMIVEFCDTSDRDGVFRKYAAFKVGSRIVPCHLLISRYWSVKSIRSEPTEDRIREGMRYVAENPHEEWLRRVFAIAGIDYGRVDYGVREGVPQVWEINLNPTVGRPTGWRGRVDLPAHVRDLREEGQALYHAQLRDAFIALDTAVDTSDISVAIDGSLIGRLAADRAARERQTRFQTTLARVRDGAPIGLTARAVMRWLPPGIRKGGRGMR